jgi:hypothetical protein
LWTSCGAFQLAPSGRLTHLPRHWLALHGGGTGRRWGAQITLRRNRAGRFTLLERGQVLWRSDGLYRNDGGSVVFGPHAFAFASYRRGVFITDFTGRERLVARGRGLSPYTFTASGQLLVAGPRAVALIARDGTPLRRFRYRARNGFSFDEGTDTFYFVNERGRLAAARGANVRLLQSVAKLDGMLAVASRDLLVFSGGNSFVVTRRDGSLVARASWRGSALKSDSGLSVSPTGREYAFRLTDAHPGARSGDAVVYVLHAGASAGRAIYRHRFDASGCAVGAGFSWHGHNLLYSSSEGTRAVIDAASGRSRDLTALARSLPRLSKAERAPATWRSDFRR